MPVATRASWHTAHILPAVSGVLAQSHPARTASTTTTRSSAADMPGIPAGAHQYPGRPRHSSSNQAGIAIPLTCGARTTVRPSRAPNSRRVFYFVSPIIARSRLSRQTRPRRDNRHGLLNPLGSPQKDQRRMRSKEDSVLNVRCRYRPIWPHRDMPPTVAPGSLRAPNALPNSAVYHHLDVSTHASKSDFPQQFRQFSTYMDAARSSMYEGLLVGEDETLGAALVVEVVPQADMPSANAASA
jgi:hypothetical protein